MTFRENAETVKLWHIVHPFWVLSLEPDFCWTCSFNQKKRIDSLYQRAENQRNLMMTFWDDAERALSRTEIWQIFDHSWLLGPNMTKNGSQWVLKDSKNIFINFLSNYLFIRFFGDFLKFFNHSAFLGYNNHFESYRLRGY